MGATVRSPNAATHIDIHGPTVSNNFGTTVTALPNGIIVITDPFFDFYGHIDIGAVYLYDGKTGKMISMLHGSSNYDIVGSGGIKVLKNGHYVVISPYWNNNSIAQAGAVTWGDKTSGVSGFVSNSNSLVDATNHNLIGIGGVTALCNGGYIVWVLLLRFSKYPLTPYSVFRPKNQLSC